MKCTKPLGCNPTKGPFIFMDSQVAFSESEFKGFFNNFGTGFFSPGIYPAVKT